MKQNPTGKNQDNTAKELIVAIWIACELGAVAFGLWWLFW